MVWTKLMTTEYLWNLAVIYGHIIDCKLVESYKFKPHMSTIWQISKHIVTELLSSTVSLFTAHCKSCMLHASTRWNGRHLFVWVIFWIPRDVISIVKVRCLYLITILLTCSKNLVQIWNPALRCELNISPLTMQCKKVAGDDHTFLVQQLHHQHQLEISQIARWNWISLPAFFPVNSSCCRHIVLGKCFSFR
jgi:hypothetical protein